MEKEYLTAKEVYQYLGISKTTFFRHGYATKLKSYCIGNRNNTIYRGYWHGRSTGHRQF